MEYSNEFSLTTYYLSLKRFADRCGIKCCRDNIIRALLVQAITDKHVLAEVRLLKDPSAEDVLIKYNELIQVSFYQKYLMDSLNWSLLCFGSPFMQLSH